MKKPNVFWLLVQANKLFSWDAALRVICLIALYIYLFIDFWKKADLSVFNMVFIIAIFAIPIIVYVLNLIQIFRRKYKTAKNEGCSNYKILFTFQNRHFISFVTILIFYTSLFVGLLIFLPKPPTTLPPRFAPGAIGLRSWKSSVVVDSLEVHYLDSSNQWRKIPEEILWDSSNWCHHTTFGKEELCPAVSFKEHSIAINRCAIIFSPPDGGIVPSTFTNFRLTAKVKFVHVESSDLFPGFMFLTYVAKGEPSKQNGVGTDKSIDSISTSQVLECDYSELCLQFNLNFYDDPHPWLPALDWQPSILSRSSIKKMKKHGGFTKPLSLHKFYEVSAIVFDDQIVFLGHGGGTCTLYETRFADYDIID